ncbi:MAG TPA: hypothetical protein VKP30_14355 [Polyangiaceae bacterium]|nr:hypothetical protein [Polyangiaceae bacterium]
MSARVPSRPSQDEQEARREQAIADCHQEIVEHIEDAISIGEQGVLDAGNLLGAIVREALAQGEETGRLLTHSNAGGVMESLGKGALTAETHIAVIDEIMSELGVQSAEAMQATRSIAQTVDGFHEVMLSTRMVGVSMRIEVAWLSDNNELGVIPEQLRSLGDEIESLTTELERLSAALRNVLPALAASSARVERARNAVRIQVAESVAELAGMTRTMIKAASDIASTRSAMTAQIRLRCEEALSQLQFFDPMVQELQRIDVLVSEFRSTQSTDSGSPPVEPIRYGRRLGERSTPEESSATVTAGEVMLF